MRCPSRRDGSRGIGGFFPQQAGLSIHKHCLPLSSKNTRLLTLNPDIRSDQLFRFSAASRTLLLAGVKRFLLTTISLLLKKTPNGINAYRKIQCFYNLQAGNIRLFFYKRKDTLLVCIREFWLLTAEIGLSFINIVSPDLF